MSNKKRGQAALEFLMTYGWAFLVIMIMIGALAYFGVLSPQNFLPDRCQFGNPISCEGDQFVMTSSDTGTIMAQFTNNGGSNVQIRNFSVSTDYAVDCDPNTICFDEDGDGECSGDDDISVDGGEEMLMEAGQAYDFVIDCDDGGDLTPGDKVKFQVEGEYYPSSSSETYAKTVSGEMYSTVTEE
ncbi:MAG: hypothetical protein ACOCZ6_03295 [Nanoarchaeota archaeon]